MTDTCIGQPVSWLRLERFALGELPKAEQSKVAAHLEECAACRTCMQELREREPVALPALPEGAVTAAIPWWRRRGPRLAWGGGLAAATAAAAIAIVLSSRGVDEGAAIPGRRTEIKGGDAIIDLVRERRGSIAYAPDTFVEGDRFEVVFTCPLDSALHADVVVYQDGEASFPLAPTSLECGNRVVLPGAFRLTGKSAATVCVVFDEAAPPNRDGIATSEPRALDQAVCTTLRPGIPAP